MLQKFEITIRNSENVSHFGIEETRKVTEILTALVESGGLTGVKGGKTIIHFDGDGEFMGISLDYWPWRKRRKGV